MPVTWNPNDKNPNLALINNDLTVVVNAGGAAHYAIRATQASQDKKVYFEIEFGPNVAANNILHVGLLQALSSLTTYVGANAASPAYDIRGYKFLANSYQAIPITSATGDVIGVAWDGVNGKIWWSKNGVWLQSGDPVNDLNPMYDSPLLLGARYPAVSFYGATSTPGITQLTAKFNVSQFDYPVPAGFLPWENIGTISGNATKASGGPVDAVIVFDWAGKQLQGSAVPDQNGDWSLGLPAGDYGISYFANGCQPVTHGPYTVALP